MSDEKNPHMYELKKDRFRRARGGNSTFFNLFCANCQGWVLLYQKDGPGALLRLYRDRIHAPEALTHPQHTLTCPTCHVLIGIAMIYKPENRSAYRLIQGSYSKIRSGGTIPAGVEDGGKSD